MHAFDSDFRNVFSFKKQDVSILFQNSFFLIKAIFFGLGKQIVLNTDIKAKLLNA